jgi:hypothetical protein
MTLKGKKNHYNVKLLRGYECSIRLKDNKVVLRGGTDVFTGKAEVEETRDQAKSWAAPPLQMEEQHPGTC